MILEKTGIRIELTNPADIRHHLALGYVEVGEVQPEAEAPTVLDKRPAPVLVVEEPEAVELVETLEPESVPVELPMDLPAVEESADEKPKKAVKK